MKLDELREDIFISEWLDNLNAAENTEDAYLQGVQAYLTFTGMTPENLILEAEEESRKGILPRHRKIKKHLIGFRKYLQEKNLADFSIRGRMTGVRSFYNSFEIELPKIMGEKRRARTVEENRAIPTKEDLQEVLKVCDPLEKAIMLTGISSGLASNEIRNIKIKHFKKGLDAETDITTLRLNREKTNVEFTTFLSPEATKAVMEYLDFRDREGKAATARRLRQLEKQRITDDEGYLFILRQIDDEFLVTQNEELRKLTENAVQKLYRSIADKAKKSTKTGVYNYIRSHTMRKFFNSALLNAGCDSFLVEFWMGHSLDDTRGAYFRASPEKLKDIYKKYTPFLTIQQNLDVLASPEYQKIREENLILRGEIERHLLPLEVRQACKKNLDALDCTIKSAEELNMNEDDPEYVKYVQEKLTAQNKIALLRQRMHLDIDLI